MSTLDELTDFSPDELPEFVAPDAAEERAEESVDRKTLLRSYFGVWVICGSFGAAAAALVFHAQVSRLIWQWSGAATSLWR